ncbi:LysM domain protein [Mannheimia varigena USDA-ARS-USMARC-1296]|uniref:LysM domain protein n=1 Tax=Mannheimia varigena USDA-ARS-USMARC-1296 TaxID=1433287 RepID=W0QAX7_9PAST|nr:peptidoglycan-binding protein LysM [Mannheimia varigena]AHG75442.1 LysM domain protein [Mannheimia varigena USDA-ARS-USMARC-1296]
MSEVIDTLAIEIAANDSFTAVAKPLLSLLERLEDAVNKNTEALGDYEKATEGTAKSTEKVNAAQDKSEKSTKKSTKALQDQEKQVKKNEKAAKNLLQAIGSFTKAIGALGTMIFAGVGLDRLAQEAAKTNKELDVTSKNLGMTSQSLATWRGAAELSGGSAQGLTGYLNNLSAGLTRLTVQGDTSVTQFFNALGINLLDGSQKAKKLEDIMLELADKFSTMDRVKAFGIAQQMGIDEGTFEMLAQGRQSLEEHLQKTAKIYKSNQQDLETARKLTAATSYLNQQFEGLKLMIANAAMPVLLKIADVTNAFFEYLQKNENLVKGVFFGIAGAITAVMMPALLKGAAAALAFIAPFLPMILIVAGLAAAFGLLYDDYQTWANGGTSLFNWGLFKRWVIDADYSVDNLKKAFADLLTGYESWEKAVNAAKSWLELKGFTKDGKMSIASLGEGFKNVAKDIYNSLIPALDKVLKVINLLLDGEFVAAWDAAKELGKDAFNAAVDFVGDNIAGDALKGAGGIIEAGVNSIEEAVSTGKKYLNGEITGSEALEEVTGNFAKNAEKAVDEVVNFADNAITRVENGFVRFVNIWGGFDPDEVGPTGNENKLMDSKQGFSQSNPTDYTKEKELSKGQFRGFGTEIDSYISEGAKKFGVDEKVLRGFVKMEDGWYGKKSATGAIGTGQFTQGTWNDLAKTKEGQAIGMTMITKKNFRTENDPRWNKRVNTLATALLAKKNGEYLKKHGIEATGENLYMAHNIGLGGFTRAMTGKATEADMLAMRQNGMKAGMTPQDFVQYQKGRYNNHYAQANKVRSNAVDMNAPIGGYAVANALNANQHTFTTMQSLSQPQNINNNQKTEVAFNGGIHINSTAGTLGGTAQDFVNGVQNRVNVMQFNTGLS